MRSSGALGPLRSLVSRIFPKFDWERYNIMVQYPGSLLTGAWLTHDAVWHICAAQKAEKMKQGYDASCDEFDKEAYLHFQNERMQRVDRLMFPQLAAAVIFPGSFPIMGVSTAITVFGMQYILGFKEHTHNAIFSGANTEQSAGHSK